MSYTAQGGGTSMTCPVPASALVLLHDGKLSCNSLKAEAPLLGRPPPCLVQPAPLNGSAADCRLGDRRLKSGTLYLFSIAPAAARRLERIRSLFFSRLEAARQLYGLRLGMGTWYRLVADHLLLPSGIRRVLYLDTDTCLLASPRAIFEAGSAQPNPLLAARRDLGYTPPARLQKLAAANRLDLRAAAARWNYSDVVRQSFNAGVLLLNLEAFCNQRLLDRVHEVAEYQATAQTPLFRPSAAGAQLSDNDVLEVAALAPCPGCSLGSTSRGSRPHFSSASA
mmetsp:Transcript_5894/g.19459  ORF Transcript_5894/g.19459 Transcript_5894/m.19459 type:complete len:281 (+) Transcript_5894:236-1078(+)